MKIKCKNFQKNNSLSNSSTIAGDRCRPDTHKTFNRVFSSSVLKAMEGKEITDQLVSCSKCPIAFKLSEFLDLTV